MLEVQEEANIDVFHVHYAIPHAVSAFLARSMSGSRFRFITTLHGTDITVAGSDRGYMRPTRFAIEQSDAVVVDDRGDDRDEENDSGHYDARERKKAAQPAEDAAWGRQFPALPGLL
jgi:glyceraldehyde-3-phosphate dehydrogenase/erythrose-4-phosphate dehydrogenase